MRTFYYSNYKLLFATLLILATLGCGNSESSSPSDAQILRKGNGGEPETIDPHLMTGRPGFNIAWALFEGLTTLDPVTLEPRPGVAERWELLDDGLTYHFEIRPDAKWSNGDSLQAKDFVYSWKRGLNPTLACAYAEFLYCVENARAYSEGDIDDFSRVGVHAAAPLTLEVRLNRPTPHFLSMLSLPFFFPVHEATIEQFGGIDSRDGKWTRAGNMVSNGLFMLEKWSPNRVLTVRKNPHHRAAQRMRLQGIDFHPTADLQTEERSFRTGKIHMTSSLAPNKIPVYQKQKSPALHIVPFYGANFYRFNTTRPPLNDPRVRRALAMSIDRESIVRNITRGGQKAAESFVPPGAGFESGARLVFDVESARALLAEAGFPGGKDFPSLSLLYNTAESHRNIAQAVQHMWKSNLGIDVTLQNQDWKVFLSTVRELDYDIARGSWIGDYVDPSNFLEIFTSGSPNNRAGYANPRYDALIQKAQSTTDRDERFRLLAEAERLLLLETPVAPIHFSSNIFLMVPQLKGFEPNALNYPAYDRLYFEE